MSTSPSSGSLPVTVPTVVLFGEFSAMARLWLVMLGASLTSLTDTVTVADAVSFPSLAWPISAVDGVVSWSWEAASFTASYPVVVLIENALPVLPLIME